MEIRSKLPLALLLLTLAAPAAPPPLHLVANYWEPYTGQDLPQQGLACEVVATALRRAGYPVDITIRPSASWRSGPPANGVASCCSATAIYRISYLYCTCPASCRTPSDSSNSAAHASASAATTNTAMNSSHRATSSAYRSTARYRTCSSSLSAASMAYWRTN